MGALRMLKSKADTVERLETDLARLNAEGAALCGEIERLESAAEEIEDAAELSKAIIAAKAARNKLRRIDREIAVVRERLDVARDEARAKQLAGLRRDFAKVAREFVAHASVAQDAMTRLIAAREAIQDAGFRQAYDATPLPPVVAGSALLAADLLELFDRTVNPAPVAVVAPAPAVAPPPVLAAPALPLVEATPAEPAPLPRKQQRELLRETPAEGERLVTILRTGLEHPRTSAQLVAGDSIALTLGEADPMIRNGAADFARA